eukprot:UN10297
MNIIITQSNNNDHEDVENESEPALKKISTIDSEMSMDNDTSTITNETGTNVLDTPVDEDGIDHDAREILVDNQSHNPNDEGDSETP